MIPIQFFHVLDQVCVLNVGTTRFHLVDIVCQTSKLIFCVGDVALVSHGRL